MTNYLTPSNEINNLQAIYIDFAPFGTFENEESGTIMSINDDVMTVRPNGYFKTEVEQLNYIPERCAEAWGKLRGNEVLVQLNDGTTGKMKIPSLTR